MEADDSADSDCELVIDEDISIVQNSFVSGGDDLQPKTKDATNLSKTVATVSHNWGIFHPLDIGSAVMKEELYQEETNTCSICKETFRYNVGLIYHLEMEHVDVDKMTGKTSSSSRKNSQKKTKKRMWNKKSAKTKLRHSIGDDESVIKAKKLGEHIKSAVVVSDVHPALISKISCEVCKKSFSQRGKLIKHMEVCSLKFHCVYCKLKFGWESKYKKHLFRIHKLNAAVICKLCSSVFSNMDDLASHSKICEKTIQVLVKSEPTNTPIVDTIIVDD